MEGRSCRARQAAGPLTYTMDFLTRYEVHMKPRHGEVKRVNGKRVASPEYRAWQLMRNRCLNSESKDYPYYGARGIRITPAWDTFEGFLADVGRRPGAEYSLDRIDSSGNYEPSNVRWATRETQSRNRAYAKTRAWELAELLGVSMSTAGHYIWRVRARDAGRKADAISDELYAKVKQFLEGRE